MPSGAHRPDEDPRTSGYQDLRNLDLNLLITLDAILQHEGVSRAAAQLGISQPSVSAALRRLRRHFCDELLYRSGNNYRLTPFAAGLRDRTKVALSGVERVFASRANLEFSATAREFVIVTSDYATAVIGPRVAPLIAERAPRARIHFAASTPAAITQADKVLTGTDLIIVPRGVLTDLPSAELFRDQWTVIMDAEHPLAHARLTVEHLETLPWVLQYSGQVAATTATRHLRTLGIEPRAQVVTESFLTVRAMVLGSTRVGLMPRLLLDVPNMRDGLAVHELPVTVGPLVEAMWWHPIYDHEPEHRFLREVMLEATAELRA